MTALDTWQRWHDDEGDEHHAAPTIADLRARLLSTDPQTGPMLAGLAGHQVLEGLAAGDLSAFDLRTPARGFSYLLAGSDPYAIEHGSYTLVPVETNGGQVVEIELRWELHGEPIVGMPLLEMKVEHTFETRLGPVTARGRIDGGDGIEVVDYKFNAQPDPEELERAWQWRLYLLATGARRIRYELFTVKPPLRDENCWRIVKRATYVQHAYPGMERDTLRAVEEFVHVIEQHVPEYWDRARREASEAPASEED